MLENQITSEEWHKLHSVYRNETRQLVSNLYSDYEKALLNSFNHINHLLGTNNSSNPPAGTLCEVLVRDLLRKVIPKSYSVDKGYTHGTFPDHSGTKCICPEIDVLIHDNHTVPELYRIDDFAIVRPTALRGAIQVKKTMNRKSLSEALQNLASISVHFQATNGRGWSDDSPWLGALAFQTKQSDGTANPDLPSFIKNEIEACNTLNPMHRVLPHFIGVLGEYYAIRTFSEKPVTSRYTQSYSVYKSIGQNERYCLVQQMIYRLLWHTSGKMTHEYFDQTFDLSANECLIGAFDIKFE